MPTAIVTGANGFIGKKLCAELLAHEYRVYGVERKQPDTDVFSGAVNYSRIVADFSFFTVSSCRICSILSLLNLIIVILPRDLQNNNQSQYIHYAFIVLLNASYRCISLKISS